MSDILKKSWKIIPIFSLLKLFFMAVVCISFAEGEIETIKLKQTQLPPEWKLTNEYLVPKDKIQIFEGRFTSKIDEMINQVFMVNGQKELKVNYIKSPNEEHTSTIYQRMFELVGSKNIVVRDRNIVIEIIAPDNDLKMSAIGHFNLSLLQRYKLKTTSVPKDWRLIKEIFIFGSQFKEMQQRFEVQFEEVINQFFLVDNMKVQVNYISCTTEADAETAYKKVESLVSGKNLVFKKDKIVVEVIATDDKIKEKARKLLQ